MLGYLYEKGRCCPQDPPNPRVCSVSWFSQQLSPHRQIKYQRLIFTRSEPEGLVEPRSSVALGVYDDAGTADSLSCALCAIHGIGQQQSL